MKTSLLFVFVITVLSALCVPGVAYALDGGGSELIGRSVTTVSGLDMAQDLVERVDGVELGSTATTVTLQVEGKPQAIAIDYGDVLGAGGDEPTTSSLVPLAFLSAGVGGLLKLLGVLTRLSR